MISIERIPDFDEWRGGRSIQQAWDECDRADWLLRWAAERLIRPRVAFVTCLCLRRGLRYIQPGETRPLAAIESVEWWCREPTPDSVASVGQAAEAVAALAIGEKAGASKHAALAVESTAWSVAGEDRWINIPERDVNHLADLAPFVIRRLLDAAVAGYNEGLRYNSVLCKVRRVLVWMRMAPRHKTNAEIERLEHLKMCKEIRVYLDSAWRLYQILKPCLEAHG